jgi:hypothetical protein
MTKEVQMTYDENSHGSVTQSSFVLRHYFVIRHSSFVI